MAASEVRIHRAAMAAAAGGVAGLRYCQVAVALVTPMRRRLLSPDTYRTQKGVDALVRYYCSQLVLPN
jgi:hypothetical protein